MGTICIDLGGGRCRVGVVDCARVVNVKELSLSDSDISSRLAAHLNDLLKDQSVTGIGVGMPGWVNLDRQFSQPNFGWKDSPIDFLGVFAEAYIRSIAVFADSCIRAAAIAEYTFGAGAGHNMMLYTNFVDHAIVQRGSLLEVAPHESDLSSLIGLGPDVIVITGDNAAANAARLGLYTNVRIATATLGEDAVLIGAAELVKTVISE
ncbi:MAG TPA: ROK family protein [Candidatus Acidoferrum sp.]|nr:ROK family protein [Candidatus Acidoferrum sp.]